MPKIFFVLLSALIGLWCAPFSLASGTKSLTTSPAASAQDTGCRDASASECLELSIKAMGGRERLESIHNLWFDEVGHTALMEQSYRQSPFITSYERDKETIDFAQGRLHRDIHAIWPESDPGQAESDSTLIGCPSGAVIHTSQGDNPASISTLNGIRQYLSLGPARLLLTAASAADLHFEQPEVIRSTEHTALAFTWQGIPVRILVNPFNHLPDAVETVQTFQDFWYFWGDVHQQIYFENWQVFHGLVYPTNTVEERNGAIWKSTQVLNLKINVPADDALFKMDAGAAAHGWANRFSLGTPAELVPGITFFSGAWNSTIIKQDDGVYILEAPISGEYIQSVIDEAKKRYPNLPIKGVFSTSDSWPHTGGVRQCVALGLPVYILDLNRPLLDHLMAAPHTIHPDPLAKSPKQPDWKIVSRKMVIGSGPNRVELYPLRGACTERQYMVYFPEHRLLYASDTLVLNDDGSLYDPEMMREVSAAVARERLNVDNVFAMHQGLVPWQKVEDLVHTALAM